MGSLLSNNSEIKDIYTNYNPAVNNLFEVEIFSYADQASFQEGSNLLSTDRDIYDYGKYHITGITLNNSENLTLSRHNITKKFYLDSTPYKWFDTIQLTWREDSSFRVRKFHEDWLKMFYDRDRDCYISSEKDSAYKRFKEIHIKFPEDTLVLKKVLPQSIPALSSFSWGSSSKILEYSLDYYVENWYWESRQ